MCELFGLSSKKDIYLNEYLKTFYSHSDIHCNGWGMVLFDKEPFHITKEPVKASDSEYLKSIMGNDIITSSCIAHIRQATIGEISDDNTHPFVMYDKTGRRWVFMHNGSIFESDVLKAYQYIQKGSTDSERIFLYIIDEINKLYASKGENTDADRFELIDRVIKEVVLPDNKVNLMIFDGEYLYVHKNEEKTLHKKDVGGGVLISTQALDDEVWEEFPQNQLIVYRQGDVVYRGEKHNNTYVQDDERMKLLFLAYSGL